MSWGKGIAVVFVVFALFIGSLVMICFRQEVGLVSKDYYSQELKYQEQIDGLANGASLNERPLIVVRGGELELQFNILSKFEHGELILTRPSDARYDATFAVSAGNDPFRVFDISSLPPGHYNTSLRWKMDGKEFLVQESINL